MTLREALSALCTTAHQQLNGFAKLADRPAKILEFLVFAGGMNGPKFSGITRNGLGG